MANVAYAPSSALKHICRRQMRCKPLPVQPIQYIEFIIINIITIYILI